MEDGHAHAHLSGLFSFTDTTIFRARWLHVIVGTQCDAEEIQLTANTRKAAQHLWSLMCTVYTFQKQP